MAAGAASTPKINCLEVENRANKRIGRTEPYSPYTAGIPEIWDGNSCYDDAGENIFGKVFLPISSQRGKQGKLHIVTSFSEKYFLLYTKESLQERSKAKVPGEKSWTKNNCHIIINAKLQ